MPPWVASAPRCIIGRQAIERLPFALRRSHKASLPLNLLRVRRASTHVSPTAINVRPNIPPQNQELYDALSGLSSAAEVYVNISRVQLALRGLAAQDAVVRIAVLSMNSQKSAQQLARLLLADPLGTEGQWEKQLGSSQNEEGKAVLLRYGDESNAHTSSPLYNILSVPSRVLRAHNIEILVSTLNTNVAISAAITTTESSKDSILVPKIQAPAATGLPVPYPTHKTLVLGEGLESAVAYGRFTADVTEGLEDMVKVAIDLPPSSTEPDADNTAEFLATNLKVGTNALNKFRESIANSEVYEHGWFQSGLPSITHWLVQYLQGPSPESLKPVLKSLICSIVDDVESNIAKQDAEQLHKLASSTPPSQTSDSILKNLETWAEQSHTELRDQLDEAFISRSWHKLAWWKLIWRVDDVSMILEDVLQRRWLVSAEKNAVYLAGQMNQAGYPETLTSNPPLPIDNNAAAAAASDPSPPSPPSPPSTTVQPPLPPWPTLIPQTRTSLLHTTLPPLQTLSQRLVLQSLTTTSLSTALATLFYISLPTFSLFEASAVAALGTVYALRRMQKVWEEAKSVWVGEVREGGRRAVKGVEDGVRGILVRREREEKEGRREREGVEERRRAREAVGRVREVLERLGRGE
ncbi:hypothetical protein EJ04DRAFT_582236 [Polyplosphaeria fusca]|uniref:Mmc1 C-terminal domain-containing protein n=1 Tax=Polyplosphaeria fusca TaxID=682080 RepID=A0A9P4UVS4_9PLEO|nr:hypothetical protein EJ04DRAFT_582236 [Polyplosphaeria fusca]